MDLNKKNVKAIRGIILFTVILALIVVKWEEVWSGFAFVLGILKPFIYGGAIALVLSIPMNVIERVVFGKRTGKYIDRCKRPVSMVLTLLAVSMVITIVISMIVPHVISTATELGRKIPAFMERMTVYSTQLMDKYPMSEQYLGSSENWNLNWETISDKLWDFVQGGFGNVLTSTFTMAGNIVSGVFNSFIALFFSFYILAQKEKLGEQLRNLLYAYSNKKVYDTTIKVGSLLHKNFSNFIAGQCLEAVILGSMFVLFLGIFHFPYAIMIGVLIAFTALIPIVGAFIGCFIGAFLILVDSPDKVIWFIILFLILQQIEGNFIYPRVVGNSVGLPAIWVLAAVIVGGGLMGVVGMLIFIPLLSTVYALLREDVYNRNDLKAKSKIAVRTRKENRVKNESDHETL